MTVAEPSLPKRLLLNPLRRGWKVRALFALKNWSEPLLQAANHLLTNDAYDVIHFNHLDTACYLQARHWPRYLKMFDSHNCLTALSDQVAREHAGWFQRLLYRRESRALRNLEHFVTQQTDVNFVCSVDDQRQFHEINPEGNYCVAPNGVDTAFFKSKGEDEQPGNLVFTGAMNYLSNEQGAIFFCHEVLPYLADLPLRIHLVGKTPSPKVTALQTADRVVVTGRVSDVRPYVERAEVFVVPLKHGSGTRLKILEAFAMGKAVVSTGIGAEGIPAKAGEQLLIADSGQAFAEAVRGLLDNPGRRQMLGHAAREFACANYDWQHINTIVAEAYQRAGQSKGSV